MLQTTATRKWKFNLKMPDTYVLIVSIIVLAAMLTYFIPAGKFNMVQSAAGQSVADAKTFHYIPPLCLKFENFQGKTRHKSL